MDTCFDKVKTGNPFKNNKAENFRELLADYKLQPDEMIYIGDTVSDIVSCREVGIRCLSASWITSCLDAQKLEAHNAGNVFYSIASLEWDDKYMCLIKKHLVFLLYEQNIRFEFLSIIIGMLTT